MGRPTKQDKKVAQCVKMNPVVLSNIKSLAKGANTTYAKIIDTALVEYLNKHNDKLTVCIAKECYSKGMSKVGWIDIVEHECVQRGIPTDIVNTFLAQHS